MTRRNNTPDEATGAPAGAAPDAASFNEAFARLEAIATKLRANENKLDIDSLLPDVQAALAAYEVCKQRLGAVSQALDEQLGAARE
jgi:exonuclease VII small subunit